MRLKKGTFEEFISSLRQSNKNIAVFGAGVLGTVTLPDVLQQYGELGRIACFVDNGLAGTGASVAVDGKEVPVYGPEHLKELDPKSYALVIAISRFMEVLEQLESLEFMADWEVFFAPVMCLESFKQFGGKGVFKTSDTPLIPKKLHYMWLGRKPIPEPLQKCMDSWKRFCPDYEIVRWDEDSYDLDKHPYMRQAYDNGMYGFVPDYARIDILLQQGGIYLDTDVELLRPIDDLLYQEAFCGVEKWQTVNLGGLSGSIPGQKGMRALLQNRENVNFINEDGSLNKRTCGYYDTKALIDHGYKLNGKVQNILGMNVYTSDYFHPYDYMSGQLETTSDTFSIHHFSGGWLTEEMRRQNEIARKKYEEVVNCME